MAGRVCTDVAKYRSTTRISAHSRALLAARPMRSMEQEQGLLDVLFEFKESRRQLSVAPCDVCEIVSGELNSLGKEGSIVELSRGQSSKASYNPHVYILQRWSPK